MPKSIPITILTGYLGAGKTTLVNRLLAAPQGLKIAVIVNDIGEINIDATLIEQKGQVSQAENNLVALTNGCICCSLQTDLAEQIIKLIGSQSFDYILIEASGVCEPIPIVEAVDMVNEALVLKGRPPMCHMDAVVNVVDAYRLLTEFSSGQDLLELDEEDEADIGRLLVEQIEFCNLALLNKTDLLTPEEIQNVEAIIRALQPSVKIVHTSYAKIDPTMILGANLFDFTQTFLSAGWAKGMATPETNATEHDHHDHEHEHDEHEHHHDHEHEHDEHEHHHDHEHIHNEHEHHHDHEHIHNEHEHHHDHEHIHDEHEHHHDHEHRHEGHGHHHDHEHRHEGHGHHGHNHEHGAEHNHLEEFGISTFIYERHEPFAVERIEEWVNDFPSAVIRCKGLVWVAENTKVSYLLEQAGKSVSVEPFGLWHPEEDDDTDEINEAPIEAMTKLVFIGIKMDEADICASLDTCLASHKLA